MREAIDLAKAVGLPREELEPAEKQLGQLEASAAKMQACRASLQRAAQFEDAQELEGALHAGAELGLPFEELDQATYYLMIIRLIITLLLIIIIIIIIIIMIIMIIIIS